MKNAFGEYKKQQNGSKHILVMFSSFREQISTFKSEVLGWLQIGYNY